MVLRDNYVVVGRILVVWVVGCFYGASDFIVGWFVCKVYFFVVVVILLGGCFVVSGI